MCYADCEGMDNQTVMAVQSLFESQNVQETLQGYFVFLVIMSMHLHVRVLY